MEIDEFLTARLDEEAAPAEAFLADQPGYDTPAWPPGAMERYRRGTPTPRGTALLAFVEMQSPARVLADIAAKRAIVAEYRSARENKAALGHHETPESWGARTKLRWICELYAAPYTDHPDFKPEWRIDG